MPRLFVICALVAPLCGAAASASGASDVNASISASTGHDSNALLEVSPAGAQARARGWFLGTEADLTLQLQRQGFSVLAEYAGDGRQAPTFGAILWHSLDLSAQWRRDTSRFDVAFVAQQLYTSRYNEDNWVGAGLRVGTSLAPADRWRFRLDLGTQAREGSSATQFYSNAAASLRWLPSAAAAVGLITQGAWLTTSLVDAQPIWQRYRFGPIGTLIWHSLSFAAAPFLGTRVLDRQAVGQFGGQVAVEHLLGWGFQWRAGIDLTKEFGATSAGRTDRLEATLAVAWSRASPRAPKREPMLPDAPDMAPKLLDGRMRFRVRAPKALKVDMVGSFDAWGEGITLRKGESAVDDVWEGWLRKPACGPLRYRFIVDGVAQTPAGAPRYVADGFGGIDGQIDISVASCAAEEKTSPDVSRKTTTSF